MSKERRSAMAPTERAIGELERRLDDPDPMIRLQAATATIDLFIAVARADVDRRIDELERRAAERAAGGAPEGPPRHRRGCPR